MRRQQESDALNSRIARDPGPVSAWRWCRRRAAILYKVRRALVHYIADVNWKTGHASDSLHLPGSSIRFCDEIYRRTQQTVRDVRLRARFANCNGVSPRQRLGFRHPATGESIGFAALPGELNHFAG